MAIICLASFPKRSANVICLRLLRQRYSEQKLVQTSPLKPLTSGKEDTAIKYTANKASTVTIAETTGLFRKEPRTNKYTAQVVFASSLVFLLYFCILREENDVDEILKGNRTNENDKIKLIHLKLQLKYCEKNNLPTAPLQAKIRELEDKV